MMCSPATDSEGKSNNGKESDEGVVGEGRRWVDVGMELQPYRSCLLDLKGGSSSEPRLRAKITTGETQKEAKK